MAFSDIPDRHNGDDVVYSWFNVLRDSGITLEQFLAGNINTTFLAPPRLTTTQRDALIGVPAGAIIYNTTTLQLEEYSGSAWAALASGGGGGGGGGGSFTPASWYGYHDNANWNVPPTSSGTFDFTSATSAPTFGELLNTNFGTVSSTGSFLPGVDFTPADVNAVYQITAAFNMSTNGNPASMQLTDGANNVIGGMDLVGDNFYHYPTTLVALWKPGTTSPVTIKLRARINFSSMVIFGQSGWGPHQLTWTIVRVA